MKKLFVFVITLAIGIFSASAFAAAEDATNAPKQPAEVSDINWYDYKRGLFIAETEKKYMVISFCTDEDQYCKKLRETTFTDKSIKQLVNDNFVAIKIDGFSQDPITINNKQFQEKTLVEQYDVVGYPTLIFLSHDGKQVSGSVRGYIPADKFATVLKYISTDAYKNTKFSEFSKAEERKMKEKK